MQRDIALQPCEWSWYDIGSFAWVGTGTLYVSIIRCSNTRMEVGCILQKRNPAFLEHILSELVIEYVEVVVSDIVETILFSRCGLHNNSHEEK